MSIKFTKMHGLGNDFMVIDGINQNINLTAQDIAFLGSRQRGIGFDQCLLIEPSTVPDADFNYRIFNVDGREVGQCGNGARCLALFVQYYGLSNKKTLSIATQTTRMKLSINDDKTVSVDMGIPKLAPEMIPFLTKKQASQYILRLTKDTSITLHAISVGNPHAILIVKDTESAPVYELGKQISYHPDFPEQTNTGFMQIINPTHIKLRVYERGCGETQACGSGAVAAAAIGRLYYGLNELITVSLPGGDLTIYWPNTNSSIILTGSATFVYEGIVFS